METTFHNFDFSDLLPCSYPTYEEWKQKKEEKFLLKLFSSYPTYEEWKHVLERAIQELKRSSYPTYEEWKP